MKKIYSILLMAAVAMFFAACTPENESYFEQSAAQRLNAAKDKYSKLLTSSRYGWAFEYYPTSNADDGALLYALKFNEDGTVDVAGDPSGEHVILTESSIWDIILDQGPVLSFSTYNNLIHMWSNPNTDGEGYKGDYEFSFVTDLNENPDSVITLRGKKRGLKCRLKMIDEDVTPEEYLLDCDALLQKVFPSSQRNYSRLVIGEQTFRLDDMKTSVASYYPFGKDPIFFAKSNSYLLAKYDGFYTMRFNKEFTDTITNVTEKNFIYNAESQMFVGETGNAKILPPHFPTLFADGLLGGDLQNVRVAKNSEMGESFKTLWTNAENSLKKKNNTLNEMTISVKNADEDCNATISLKYKPKTGAAAEMFYKFNLSRDGDQVKLQYVGPYNNGAQNVLNNFPECEALVKAFEGTFTVENPGEIQFNVVSLKLVGVSDPALSVVGSVNYPAESSSSR